jgi:hypothetical protein
MIILWLILDICFYNFTKIKTSLIIISLIKPEKITLLLLVGLFIDFCLSHTYGLFTLILLLLYLFNKKIKIDKQNIFSYFLCFLIMEFLYLLLVYLIFRNIGINLLGLILTIIFFLWDKKA